MNFVISPANPLQKSSKLYGGKTNESNDFRATQISPSVWSKVNSFLLEKQYSEPNKTDISKHPFAYVRRWKHFFYRTPAGDCFFLVTSKLITLYKKRSQDLTITWKLEFMNLPFSWTFEWLIRHDYFIEKRQ